MSAPRGKLGLGLTLQLAVAISLLGSGCNHHVYSPPARSLPLESMATVGRARTGLALEGAQHGAVFGVSAGSGTARFRHGVADEVDLSLEGNVIHIQGDPAADTDQDIYSLRMGAKYNPLRVFAVTAGTGFGLHAAGSFVSPDIGLIAGFENRVAVPFLAVRGLVSIPLRSHPVDTSSSGNMVGTDVGEPQLTGGLGSTLGLRVPIPTGVDQTAGVRGSFLGGVGLLWLSDSQDSTVVASGGGGGEVAF